MRKLILEAIAIHSPYSYVELDRALSRLQSIDLLVVVVAWATASGCGLESAVDVCTRASQEVRNG